MIFQKTSCLKYQSTCFKNREKFALCFVDIDKIKLINDAYGHLVGDGILTGIVNGIQRLARANDFFGRLGGDEFIVIYIKSNKKYNGYSKDY